MRPVFIVAIVLGIVAALALAVVYGASLDTMEQVEKLFRGLARR